MRYLQERRLRLSMESEIDFRGSANLYPNLIGGSAAKQE